MKFKISICKKILYISVLALSIGCIAYSYILCESYLQTGSVLMSIGSSLGTAILVTWSMEGIDNKNKNIQLDKLKERELGFLLTWIKELARCGFEAYASINRSIWKESEILLKDALNKIYENDVDELVEADIDAYDRFLVLRDDIVKNIKIIIIRERRYFLDKGILNVDEFSSIKSLCTYLENIKKMPSDVQNLILAIEKTYIPLKKINNSIFRISNCGIIYFNE